MLISTTSTIEGKIIKEYKGIVFGEIINGINYRKDISASLVNIVGGRVTEYENELISTRAEAMNEMIKRAKDMGANAIIGAKVDYETMGQSSAMLAVIASGTAVVIE